MRTAGRGSRCRFVLAGAILLGWMAALAEEPDSAPANPLEELFQTDVVYPQEKGEWQFTMTPSFQRQPRAQGLELPLSIEYGMSDAWQIELEWVVFHLLKQEGQGATRGIGDLELGSQYSFLNVAGSAFHLAPRLDVQFPTGNIDKGLTEGFIEYEPSVILARDFESWHHLQVFAQIGVAFQQRAKSPPEVADRESAAHELVWSVGAFLPLAHWVTSLELSGSDNRWNHDGDENRVYLTPGLAWRVKNNLELGLGIPIGLNRESDRFQIITRLVLEF